MTITAIAKLLQHGVNSNDSRLTEITVRGDQVFQVNIIFFSCLFCFSCFCPYNALFQEGRSTRSSRRQEQWTQVPLLAKLLKLLVNEMQNVVEEVREAFSFWICLLFLFRTVFQADNGGEESSDEDEGWEEDSQDSDANSQGNSSTQQLDLSRLLQVWLLLLLLAPPATTGAGRQSQLHE